MSKKTAQSKLNKTKPESTLHLTSGIGARILEAVSMVGGKKELSRKANISASQLYRIISEDSQARIETIVSIAQAAGVSVEWLATGQGEKDILHSDPVTAQCRDTKPTPTKNTLLEGADTSHHNRQIAEPKTDYKTSKVLVDQSFIDGLLVRQTQLMDKQIQLMDQLQSVRDELQKVTS